MRTLLFTAGALAFAAAGCGKKPEAEGRIETPKIAARSEPRVPSPGSRLYMDVHHLGAGKATAEDVAAAHRKDVALQAKHGVKYLNYWFDAESGTVMCLSEAPSKEAAVAVHREAHGLIPDTIEEVTEGR